MKTITIESLLKNYKELLLDKKLERLHESNSYIESRLRGEELVLENITRNLEKILEEEAE